MAFENVIQVIDGGTADADLSSSQYFCVELTSTGVALANADTDDVFVLQNKPASGEMAQIAIGGVTKVVAGAAIARGARVAPTAANGKAQTAASGDKSFGIALEAAGADGDIISVLISRLSVNT